MVLTLIHLIGSKCQHLFVELFIGGGGGGQNPRSSSVSARAASKVAPSLKTLSISLANSFAVFPEQPCASLSTSNSQADKSAATKRLLRSTVVPFGVAVGGAVGVDDLYTYLVRSVKRAR